MQLINKTQTEKNIDNLEKRIDKATLALAQTVNALNSAYECVWTLPDEQLRELLQCLFDNNKLQDIFNIHAQSAANINALLDAINYSGARAKEGAGREYTIIDGIIGVIPLLQPEPVVNIEDFKYNQF